MIPNQWRIRLKWRGRFFKGVLWILSAYYNMDRVGDELYGWVGGKYELGVGDMDGGWVYVNVFKMGEGVDIKEVNV